MTPPRHHEGGAGAAMADGGGGAPDYLELALRSTHKVKRWVEAGALELSVSLCSKVIYPELQRVEDFLIRNYERLMVKDLVADKGRVALLQLYAVVKQGESLVQPCCESAGSAWPKRALRLCAMKEDVLDVVLHLRWWEAVLHMVIDSETSRVRLERANREFEEMLNLMALFNMMDSSEFDAAKRQRVVEKKREMFERIQGQEGLAYAHERGTKAHLEFILAWDYAESATTRHAESDLFKDALIRCIELQKAALEDKAHLVDKALELMGSFTGDARTAEYLLATQVYSLLTDMEVTDVPGLDEYKIKFSIGHGQFGVVNHVTWCGQECALKQIECDLRVAERSEANSLKRFSHPHIVKFYRHFVACPGGDANQRRHSHIVMEEMPFDLKQYMDNARQSSSRMSSAPSTSSGAGGGAPFSEPVAVDIMLQVAKAMWHMHSKFGVHRDLKPRNVLVQQVSPEELPELFAQGYVLVKLGDFGHVVENMMSSYPQLDMTHKAGTSLYRAPELSVDHGVEESNHVRKKTVPVKHPHMADSWSFGMMGSEIVTGDLPLVDDPPRPIRLDDMQKNVRPELPRDCPDYLRFCIESCWQYDPLERPRFADIWRMLRFANLRSLGLIDNDMDFFMYRNRKDDVVSVRTRSVLQKPAEVEPGTPTSVGVRPNKTKPSKGLFRSMTSVLLNLNVFGKPRQSLDQGLNIHSVSPHTQPFTYTVNRVWPQSKDADWKLDVIFFEGNVGGRQHLSCRDTWLQRNKPKVFWPREWLPEDVHKGDIRVLVLQYNISDKTLEGLVNDIKKFLILSPQWNQNYTWRRPIVLVGHSLGCTVIEALVLDLERNEMGTFGDSSMGSASDHDRMRETSKAFMRSLRGCFFYAYPSYGLQGSHSFLKEVFGGLTSYSEFLFASEFQVGSENLLHRSMEFLRIAYGRNPQIRLMSLVEGGHTRGTFVVPRLSRPPEYSLTIENTKVLPDSNHIQICKPVDRQHPSYQDLVNFLISNSFTVNPPARH